jgi:hypothetical protein
MKDAGPRDSLERVHVEVKLNPTWRSMPMAWKGRPYMICSCTATMSLVFSMKSSACEWTVHNRVRASWKHFQELAVVP